MGNSTKFLSYFIILIMKSLFLFYREKKIALKGNNKSHLLELMGIANERKIPCYLVTGMRIRITIIYF